MEKYLNMMEASFTFEFDGEFNQKVDTRYRSCLDYDGLSTGQKARANMAILFAFIEFAERKSGSRVNLLSLDEVLDVGLDKQGKETIS